MIQIQGTEYLVLQSDNNMLLRVVLGSPFATECRAMPATRVKEHKHGFYSGFWDLPLKASFVNELLFNRPEGHCKM